MMSSSSSSSAEDPKLPHDVAVEVLKRLPAESLLRFRCVCRSWRSAIDDPRFVALHLTHSAQDASNRYLVSLDWYHRLCSLFPDDYLTLPPQSQIEIPFAAPPIGPVIVGSCNGLICVAETCENGCGRWMYLWNVFTRKHKAVRRTGPGHQFFPTGTAYEVLGFGFDARSHDHTIVRILYSLDDNRRCFSGTKAPVEIYSLGTDSWRSLECEVPALCGFGTAVFLNGNLHWPSLRHDDGGYRSIVSFDIAGEAFHEMALPEEIFHKDNGSLIVSVAVLNDLLAVFISFIDAAVDPELHSVCSVWVMREYGVPQSWTKLYSFEACGLVSGFDGFTRNGELLMIMDDENRVSWNPVTGQYANLPQSMYCDLVTVLESIVSL